MAELKISLFQIEEGTSLPLEVLKYMLYNAIEREDYKITEVIFNCRSITEEEIKYLKGRYVVQKIPGKT